MMTMVDLTTSCVQDLCSIMTVLEVDIFRSGS